jgi:hypothetical protein
MRALLFSLALVAAPAAAQAPSKPADPRVETVEVVRVLGDPAMAQKMTNVLQALSKALLDLPVGEVEAAIEGRPVTPADKGRTVRSVGREENPNFERDLQRELAQAGPIMQSSMKALATSLPAMMKSMEEVTRAMERAMANLPSPTYPKR